MRKSGLVLLATILLIFCSSAIAQTKQVIAEQLDAWHLAASEANADAFFGFMADDCMYIGTDKSEKWQKDEFMKFAKPYFDRGRAWDFKALNREVWLNESEDTAWFDEQLDTWMGVCQASGVLQKGANGVWKLRHYQLSMTIDNIRYRK